MAKKKFYAVARGRRPGIYTTWYGSEGAEVQVRGFPGARYRGFATREAAREFLENPDGGAPAKKKTPRRAPAAVPPAPPGGGGADDPDRVLVYTDGGCIRNPGPGGWGAVVIDGRRRRELSGGYRLTTNNRMELTACIMGLSALNGRKPVTLYTDSKYVADGISRGWARKWRSRGWMRTAAEKAVNADLWARLLELVEARRVTFVWVKGHAGIPENERCDRLAGHAARGENLPPDPGYEKG